MLPDSRLFCQIVKTFAVDAPSRGRFNRFDHTSHLRTSNKEATMGNPVIYGNKRSARLITGRDIILGKDGFPLVVGPRDGFAYSEHFITTATNGNTNFTLNSTGTGASNAITAAVTGESNQGCVFIGGGDATSHSSIYQVFNNYIYNQGITWLEFRTRSITLSTGAEEYTVEMGLIDNAVSVDDISNGCSIRYDRANNGDFWSYVTADGGTETEYVADGGASRDTNAVALSTYDTTGLIFDPTGGTCNFFFNYAEVSASESTTNLPTADADKGEIGMRVHKTVGNTARNWVIDYIRVAHVFDSRIS